MSKVVFDTDLEVVTPSMAHSPASDGKARPHDVLHIDSVAIAPRASVDLRTTRAHLRKQHEHLFKDRIFSDEEWKTHISWKRYLPEPWILLRVILVLFFPLLWIILVSVSCGIYQEFRKDYMPNLNNINLAFAYTLCTFAMSLLLVFQTNSSYARWAEARTAWGATYIRLRDLIRKAMMYSPQMPLEERKMFVRWAIAMPYLMRSHLLSYVPGSLVLSPLLTEQECDWLDSQPHKPLAALEVMGTLIAHLGISPMYVVDMNRELGLWHLHVAICEKISRTPIPMAYTRHTVRFLSVYVTVLPLALWSNAQWWTVLLAPTIAFLLLGIENIGNQLENPLLVLPMAAYCATIHANINGMTDDWISNTDLVRSLVNPLHKEYYSVLQTGEVHLIISFRKQDASFFAAGAARHSSIAAALLRDKWGLTTVDSPHCGLLLLAFAKH